MMRTEFGYGCIGYSSAAKCHLKKLDIQQALRIRIRTLKLMLAYWVNLQGHRSHTFYETILEDSGNVRSPLSEVLDG